MPASTPDEIPPSVVITIARDRDPDGDDIAELIHDATGAALDVAEAAAERDYRLGFIDYNDLAGDLLNNAVPTELGLKLLAELDREKGT